MQLQGLSTGPQEQPLADGGIRIALDERQLEQIMYASGQQVQQQQKDNVHRDALQAQLVALLLRPRANSDELHQALHRLCQQIDAERKVARHGCSTREAIKPPAEGIRLLGEASDHAQIERQQEPRLLPHPEGVAISAVFAPAMNSTARMTIEAVPSQGRAGRPSSAR
uniref:Uncharacterized protein n=1 Tax=Haptolina ericina TaxID=156174 RepID=A0A7S3BPT5_9EUKA